MCTGTSKAWIGGLGELSFVNQSSSSANILVSSYTGTGTKNTNPISVTLPFISYGGSSLVISMFMMGIINNILHTADKTLNFEYK